MVLRTRPHRSGAHATSNGSDPIELTRPVLAEGEFVRLDDERDAEYDREVPTVGKSCEWASAISVRAVMKFSKNCLMFWLSIFNFSSAHSAPDRCRSPTTCH